MPYSERPHTKETKKEKPKPEDREFFNVAKSTEIDLQSAICQSV